MVCNRGRELIKYVLCKHSLIKETKKLGQKTVLHNSKRLNSIVEQHRLSIWLDIKTINEKQSVVSLFIFRISFVLRSLLTVSRTIRRGRYNAKEIGTAQCAPCYLTLYLMCHYFTLEDKTKQDILQADDFIVKGIVNSHKMRISSACSYCTCIHCFSQTSFPCYFFVL